MSASENEHLDAHIAAVEEIVSHFSPEERMLVVLKGQLYDGRWDQMLDDLSNRLTGKPYVFKLTTRIKDDIERVHALKSIEDEYCVDLSDYVSLK